MGSASNLANEITQLRVLQNKVQKRLKSVIADEIKSCEQLDGVKVVSPIVCVVKASTMQKEGRWSAELFHPDVQIKNVMGYLFGNKKTSVDTIIKKIHELAKTGKFAYPTSHEIQYLNSNMLSIIKNLDTELTIVS